MFDNNSKPILVIGVSPLWELEYTGISNVVFELAKRFFFDQYSDFDVRFSVFDKLVDRCIIEQCLKEKNGSGLQTAFQNNNGIAELNIDAKGGIDGKTSYGLFLHTKPNKKTFYKDSHLYYDFSFLLTGECHTKETVDFHLNGLVEQIETTDLFFCISESTANDLNWLFNVKREEIVVSLLGSNVNADFACQARNLIGAKKIEPYFLVLGTIEPRKNVALIFSWLRKNKKILSQYRFVFAGRDGWGPSFNEYIESNDLTDEVQSGRILHLGYINESLKATLIVGAQAILYPSIFEGFGLPVLEAMELGVPVIASCSTSIPEVLGETGYYFDPYSIESLNQAMSSFILDQLTGNVDAICRKAKERAAEFSYDKTYSVICRSLKDHFIDIKNQPAEENIIDIQSNLSSDFASKQASLDVIHNKPDTSRSFSATKRKSKVKQKKRY